MQKRQHQLKLASSLSGTTVNETRLVEIEGEEILRWVGRQASKSIETSDKRLFFVLMLVLT